MNSAAFKILRKKIEWKLAELISSFFDFLLWTFHIPLAGIKQKPVSGIKRILFIGEQLPPRTARIAKWLSRTGTFECILICSKRGFVEKFSDPHFRKVFLFRNAWHLRRILRNVQDIYLMHSFAPKSHFPDVARLANPTVPFIHDMQDVYAIYYGLHPTLRWLKNELPHERACLELADGLIGHSLEPNIAYRKYGIKHKPPNLFYPLYCDDDYFCEPTTPHKSNEIHLVYAGGVAGSHRNPKQYGSIMFGPLIHLLSEQKIHFHIYPSPSNIREDYEEYEKLDGVNPYFHFHASVSQQNLAKELSRYDWGILPFFSGQNEQSEDKYKYATTLKLFNYLEAGIPVLVSRDIIYQSWIVERYRCGMGLRKENMPQLREILEKEDLVSYKENVLLAREKLSLSRNIPRLIDFYSKIHSRKVH